MNHLNPLARFAAWMFSAVALCLTYNPIVQDGDSSAKNLPVSSITVAEDIVFEQKGETRVASIDLGSLDCGVETRVIAKLAGPLDFVKVRSGCKCKLLKIDKLNIKESEIAVATFSFKTPPRSKQTEKVINYSFVTPDYSEVAALRVYYSLKGNLSLDDTSIDLNIIEGVEKKAISKIPFVFSKPVSKHSLVCSVLGDASGISAELTFTEPEGQGMLVVTGNLSENSISESAVVRVNDTSTGASDDLAVKLREVSPVAIRPRILRLNKSKDSRDYRCQFLIKSHWDFSDQNDAITVSFDEKNLGIETEAKSATLRWVLLSIDEEKLAGERSGLFYLTLKHANGNVTHRELKWALPAN